MVVRTGASQQEGGAGPLCVEFACSHHACMTLLWLLGFPPIVKHNYVKLILLSVPLTKKLTLNWSWSPGTAQWLPTAPTT